MTILQNMPMPLMFSMKRLGKVTVPILQQIILEKMDNIKKKVNTQHNQ